MPLSSLFSALLLSADSPTSPQRLSSPAHSLPFAKPLDIPLEIVVTILELLYYNNDDGSEEGEVVDTAILKSCSLVCRTWAMPAQKLLFRRVVLQSQKALESFVDAIADRSSTNTSSSSSSSSSSSRGRVLGDAVRRLRVIMDHNQPSGIHQHSFALCVSLCPNLTSLSLSLYGCAAPGKDIVGSPAGGDHQLTTRVACPVPWSDEQTVQLLTSGPAITELEFSNWSEDEQATAQVLRLWPNLKSLSISGTAPSVPSGAADPFPCQLEALRLNFQTAPSQDYLKWLLHHSSDSLRVLEFEREPPAHLLEYLLATHSATLRSLSLPSISSQDLASAIQKCSQLRELRTETPSAMPVLYRKLPESLEHMAFGMDRDSVLHPVLEAVKSRSSIKTVTVQIWTGGELHKHLSKLKIECAWRGMQLRVTNNVRLFRSMTRRAW